MIISPILTILKFKKKRKKEEGKKEQIFRIRITDIYKLFFQ